MHEQPNRVLPDPASPEYEAQRLVLAELVVDAPEKGDELAYLRDMVGVPPAAIEPAVAALEAAGLARRDGSRVRATWPARYFAHLCPVRP
jgi:hypothetical protein